jgi:hypothetical protein
MPWVFAAIWVPFGVLLVMGKGWGRAGGEGA